MLSSRHRRYETKARPSSGSDSGAGAALCDYPRCKCAFLWCEGKHPPCPLTGERHPEMDQ